MNSNLVTASCGELNPKTIGGTGRELEVSGIAVEQLPYSWLLENHLLQLKHLSIRAGFGGLTVLPHSIHTG